MSFGFEISGDAYDRFMGRYSRELAPVFADFAGIEAEQRVLDVGCGSGVLSIAASRFGFAPIVAVDLDPVAVDVTSANAAANGVALDAYALDATIESLPPIDVAVANVSADVVTRVLPRLRCRTVITSGYLEDAVLAPDGWTRVTRSTAEGWAADHYERESSV